MEDSDNDDIGTFQIEISKNEQQRMKYSLEWLLKHYESNLRMKFLFFWGHQTSKNGTLTSSCFSQWYISPFVVDGVKYNTAEHWMMAQKALVFKDNEIYKKVLGAKSAAEAKALGREVRNFEESIWNDKRSDIVIAGGINKFTQNKDLGEFLLNTKERILVEASPIDNIWGVGLSADDKSIENPNHWDGLNLLGFALMEVRDIIKI